MQEYRHTLAAHRAQSLTEFALIAPLLVGLLVGIIELGGSLCDLHWAEQHGSGGCPGWCGLPVSWPASSDGKLRCGDRD